MSSRWAAAGGAGRSLTLSFKVQIIRGRRSRSLRSFWHVVHAERFAASQLAETGELGFSFCHSASISFAMLDGGFFGFVSDVAARLIQAASSGVDLVDLGRHAFGSIASLLAGFIDPRSMALSGEAHR